MSHITPAIQSVLSDVSVDSNGVVSISRHGLCELLGIRSDNLIFERMAKKLAEKLTCIGFEISSLGYGEAIPDTAIALIVEYYAFDAQKKSEMAQALYRSFAAIGIRKFFQEAKGWEPSKPVKLPPPDERLSRLKDTLTFFDIDINNPRYKQGLQDYVLDVLGVATPALPETQEQWVGVVERAEALGYSQAKKLEVRSLLGRFVSKHGKDTLQTKMEKRLCNGTQREIKLYLVCDALDNYIRCFFAG